MMDLSEVMQQTIRAYFSSIYTAMPGIIQSYDAKTKTVTVLPSVKMTYENGETLSMPLISDVQVVFPGTQRAIFQYELKKGDGCLLLFSSESLEQWNLGDGKEVESGDPRRFALTDAFCIPGLMPPKAPGKTGISGDLEIGNKQVKLVMNESQIEITAQNLVVNGDMKINGKLTVTGDATIGGISFLNHVHAYTWGHDPGGGDTQKPQ